MWDCPRCNLENKLENLVCSACQEPRPYTPLQQLIINSADEYYRHLEAHNLGTTTIRIRSRISKQVEAPKSTTDHPIYHTHWTFDLGGSLYDLDGFFIKEIRNENPAIWNNDAFKVIEYDNEQHRLTVGILRDEQTFSQIPCNDLRIVSDLKFLVKNVEKWAKGNGKDLRLPETVYTAFQNNGGDKKPEIEHILKHPVQYVWGPPGTGKTRYALLNAVEQVVLAGGQAAVFAPTNSAVENALEPIIEKGFCSRDKILRLGTPSHSFASKYPECCEEIGVQKKVKQISQQIHAWEEKLARREDAETAIRTLEELAPLFSALDDFKGAIFEKETACSHHKKEMDSLREQREDLVRNTAEVNVRIKNAEQALSAVQRDIKRYYGSGFRSFVSGFQTRPERNVLEGKEKDCKDELERLCAQHSSAEKRIEELLVEEAAQKRLIERYEKERTKVSEELEQQVSQLRQRNTPRPPINNALASLAGNGIDECKQTLDEIRKNAEEALALIDQVELKNEILQAQEEKERLGQSTQEVLEKKQVIAMTLDKYISLFMDIPLKCAHKFVDEAGFAPMIKALCLFNDSGIPVTFIGDHKQIPPIVQDGDGNLSARTINLWGQPSMCALWLIKATKPFEVIEQSPPEMGKIYPNMHILNKTYRFGDNLAKLLDQFIYKCGLESGAKHPLKLCIVDVRAVQEAEKKVNKEEAASAVEYLTLPDQISSVAIITPYLNQVRTIKGNLPYRQKEQLFTVHKAQGREWDTVIFSVVDDGKPGREPWFTDVTNTQADADKLLNTALSRAKKELVLICNVNYWLNRPDADRQLISQLIRLAQEKF